MGRKYGSRKVGVLPGDGIGPEVTAAAVEVLHVVSEERLLGLKFEYGLIGGCALDVHGTPLPEETIALCRESDAILLGAVGGPRWDHLPQELNPGLGGLLRLRRDFDLFANLRPGISHLLDQPKVDTGNIDILLVREAVGGAYFSPKRGRVQRNGKNTAFDTMEYDEDQIRRVVNTAAKLALSRNGKLTSVDKANVLESSRLWREVAQAELAAYPELVIEHLYVDNCAMQLVLRPASFDVLVTENLFGDILSDEIAGIVGSLGLLPSASIRADGWGLYEPVHGSAPEIAGQGIANPTAAILSAAMMLKHTFELGEEAGLIEESCRSVIASGVRTQDIARPSDDVVSTQMFAQAVCQKLRGALQS